VLGAGDSFTIEFDVEINPRQVTGSLGNQVSGSGAAVDNNGTPVLDSAGNQLIANDLSDSGTDPTSTNSNDPFDNGTSDDVSQFTPPAVPRSEISGFVFLDENGNGVADLGESGIEGVEITLTGQDVFGVSVEIVTLTDGAGRYVFSGLNAGVYTLQQVQPSQFSDGLETGEVNSIVGNDVISNIQLGFGQTLDSSRFGERLSGTSGFPPNLPSLGPIALSSISSLLTGFPASSSPIYSGTTIDNNANPLSLNSNRPVYGGYTMSANQSIADSESDFIDQRSEIPNYNIFENRISETVRSTPEQETTPTDTVATPDASVTDQQTDAPLVELSPPVDQTDRIPLVPKQKRPSIRFPFLKRLANWLSR